MLTVYAGIVVPKNSLFVDSINRVITGIKEFGVLNHLYTKDVPIRFGIS